MVGDRVKVYRYPDNGSSPYRVFEENVHTIYSVKFIMYILQIYFIQGKQKQLLDTVNLLSNDLLDESQVNGTR